VASMEYVLYLVEWFVTDCTAGACVLYEKGSQNLIFFQHSSGPWVNIIRSKVACESFSVDRESCL
jgi:hypothetical protein